MIYIEKDTVNKVMLTLWESTTIDTPYYALMLTNESTEEKVYLIAPDESLAVGRFNLLSITEQATSLDPLNGVVRLSPVGQWNCEIYESPTQSIDPLDWGQLLQTEIVIVSGVDQSVSSIYR